MLMKICSYEELGRIHYNSVQLFMTILEVVQYTLNGAVSVLRCKRGVANVVKRHKAVVTKGHL